MDADEDAAPLLESRKRQALLWRRKLSSSAAWGDRSCLF
jgi:hypothetical protein